MDKVGLMMGMVVIALEVVALGVVALVVVVVVVAVELVAGKLLISTGRLLAIPPGAFSLSFVAKLLLSGLLSL